MPTPRARYRVITHREATLWRWGLALQSIYLGAVHAFGPPSWYSSPSLTVLKHWLGWLPGDPLVWVGLVVLALGALVLTPWRKAAHFGLMLVWQLWAIALLAAIVTGDTVSAGGWAFVALTAAVHGYQLEDRRPVPAGHPSVSGG